MPRKRSTARNNPRVLHPGGSDRLHIPAAVRNLFPSYDGSFPDRYDNISNPDTYGVI